MQNLRRFIIVYFTLGSLVEVPGLKGEGSIHEHNDRKLIFHEVDF